MHRAAPGESDALADNRQGSLDLHDPSRRSEVEAALRELGGIVAARIVAGFERTIDEIHVVAESETGPKQVVRDIQTLLYARFGISIDHRVCSVVQMDAGHQGVGRSPRPRLVRVRADHDGIEHHAGITIAAAGGELDGSASGPASAEGRRRATARATLAAIVSLLPEGESAEIDGVLVTSTLGHDVAITVVSCVGPDGSRTLVGSAIVGEDENTAVARSVLDALNRRLSRP